MSQHLHRQIEKLKRMALALGAHVEEAVTHSIQSVQERDADLAQTVIAGDRIIDLQEVDLEEEILHTLALHQPVAFDLRYVIAILKINNDLERVGDLAVNIAQQAIFLTRLPEISHTPFHLPDMTRRVRLMLKHGLDALVHIDSQLARAVIDEDDAVDEIHREMYRKVEQAIRADPELVKVYLHLLTVSRNLERMADHIVNIVRDVIYTAEGEMPNYVKAEPTPAQEGEPEQA